MPKGPKGENRPSGVVACAVHVARIATGEVEDRVEEEVEEGVHEYSIPENMRVKKEKEK